MRECGLPRHAFIELMNLSSLTALSSIDGRYAGKTAALRPVCSEFGLIHRRIIVEVRWFQSLAGHAGLEEIPALSEQANIFLDRLVAEFSETEALRVKKIEAVTNHDVKAVEYYLKERFSEMPELAAHSEFLHFACTSEDINNLSYALMMKDAHAQVLSRFFSEIDGTLLDLSARYAGQAMLSRTHGQTASPTTLGKEMANTLHRLRRQTTADGRAGIPGENQRCGRQFQCPYQRLPRC